MTSIIACGLSGILLKIYGGSEPKTALPPILGRYPIVKAVSLN